MSRRIEIAVQLITIILAARAFDVAAADAFVVNPETTTYDYYPSTAASDDGSTWISWHGYKNSRDQIYARHISSNGSLGKLHTVSKGGTVHGPPHVLADSDSTCSIVWSVKQNGHWRILLRQYRDGQWLDSVHLSGFESDAIFSTAQRLSDGTLIVAWSECRPNRIQVRGCLVEDGKPTQSFLISSGEFDAFRPVLIAHGSEVWAIWDQYEQPSYSVHTRRVFPETSDIEQVSLVGEYCLTPTALSHQGKLYIAWLQKADVLGGPDVVSQWHTLHVARKDVTGWKQMETPDGQTAAAQLTQGLMAQIEPKPVATGGYLGPRIRPSLLADGERVWLLWERKSNHRGSTPTVSGDLVGRSFVQDHWQDPVVLSQQRIDYHLVDPPVIKSGKVRFLASRMPSKGLRSYELFDVDVGESEPFVQAAWTGWNPVELPIQNERAPARTISADGKTYRLYWGDLHCHNGLTADAEGEPDEMHAYARDRAELDVVVFTNNDFYNVPLTQYEFELGHLFASIYSKKNTSEERRLLSLPGYEWTSRIPGVKGIANSNPGSWLPPYRHRSYPNHRSVIYPPEGGPLVHFTEVGNDISSLNSAVQKAGGITLSQHNAFKLSGHSVEVGFELTSGWSNYIATHPQLFHKPLNQGAKLGFTANGDTHRRAPGLSGALTGIYAESLSAEAILDALRSRRCYATMGAKIFIDSRVNSTLMGQETRVQDGEVPLNLHVIGTRPITSAVLIRDGQEIHRVTGQGTLEFKTTYRDENLTNGTHWYYWRVSQEQVAPVLPGNLMPAHGHLAWSTPHWVVVE